MTRLITLTTDFGLWDEFVGVMKGVILSRLPSARTVDLCHQIPPGDLRRAAFILESSRSYFPAGTLHVVVVDPGVGTDRRIILLEAGGQLFLAPDNGVLTLQIRNCFTAAYEVSCRELFLQPVSNTFHGRDIFAPLAAELAKGLAPAEVGMPLSKNELITLSLPEAVIDPGAATIVGQVTDVDHFGNLLTNISLEAYRQLAGNLDPDRAIIRVKDRVISLLAESYGAAPPGGLLAIFASRDFLEIAINQGNAARELGVAPDEQVTLYLISLHGSA
jgi:S-adenosyl-L-methionine hydrolase (adenosine-forming)